MLETLLIMVVCVPWRSLGLAVDLNTVPGYSYYHDPVTFVSPNTPSAPVSFGGHAGTSASQSTIKGQASYEVPDNLLNLVPTQGEPAKWEYQGHVTASRDRIQPAGKQVAANQDTNVSPYWADPEGRAPSQAPVTVAEDLATSLPSCREAPGPCNASARYRSINGRCNNLQHPHLGTSGQPMPRILPAVYDFSLMRTRSVGGGLLPNPRLVSLKVREVPPAPSTPHNLLLMQVGQFLDHDISVISVIKSFGQESKLCMDCDSWRDPVCAPIPIPESDSYFHPHQFFSGGPRCLPFTRSGAVGGRDDLGRPTLDQLTLNTAFLDLNTVYGSDHCQERSLRLYSGGKLVEVYRDNSGAGFPSMLDADKFEDCRTDQKKCFHAGDMRSNENLGLMVMHVIFFREHNRLAAHLSALNPHWDDERIFQEARRVNIAQYQHIMYSEFLPVLLGQARIADYRLAPLTSGYYQGYDETVNPGVLNEFSTAAFRVGHTMVPNHLLLFNSNYLPIASVSLVQTFHNASMVLLPEMCEHVLRGLLGTRLKPVDLHIESSVVDQLFEDRLHHGQDLFVRNVARGRDHGLAPYLKYREACGGGPTSTFEDLLQVMSPQAVTALRQAYTKVEDIDLYPGALAEYPVPGGLVGPTFACILSYQFLNLRRADRFWYENGDNGLTLSQLATVRTTASLAHIICNNMADKGDLKFPRNIFFLPSNRENPLDQCDQLPSMVLELWKEQHTAQEVQCTFRGRQYLPSRYVQVSPCLTCLCYSHGYMQCKPNLSGCQQVEQDEHCMLVC